MRKWQQDLLALLADHDLGLPIGLDVSRLLEVTRDDWGSNHTIRLTLQQLLAGDHEMSAPQPHVSEIAHARARELLAALEGAPRSMQWRLRDAVGARLQRYDEPEVPQG